MPKEVVRGRYRSIMENNGPRREETRRSDQELKSKKVVYGDGLIGREKKHRGNDQQIAYPEEGVLRKTKT